MSKLIELKEAAEMLGVSPELLTEMRSRNEIFGYRDGATWKFKQEEVERVAAARGSDDVVDQATDAGESGIDADLDQLVDVDELGLEDLGVGADQMQLDSGDASEPATVGDEETIQFDAGDANLAAAGDDVALDLGGSALLETGESALEADDIELDTAEGADSILVSEEELGHSDESTSSTIIGKRDQPTSGESDLQLAIDELEGSGSDLELVDTGGAGGGQLSAGGSDVLNTAESDDEPNESETANLSLEAAEAKEGLDALEITEEDELSLDGSQVELGTEALGGSGVSDFGSAVELDLDDDDDELVLGSGTGSDVTISPADSGINLTKPSDSGLSLEDEPLDLGGSAVESLELGEDDMLALDEETDTEAATQLKADDDFLLTPVEDEGEEASDSGSQVIALDTEEFDESAATMLATDAVPLLEEDAEMAAAEEQAIAAAPLGAGAPLLAPAEAPEAPYSIWNVLSLFFIVVILAFTGVMMMDLIKNMWSWDGTYSFNSSIMDSIIELLGG